MDVHDQFMFWIILLQDPRVNVSSGKSTIAVGKSGDVLLFSRARDGKVLK